MNKFPAHFELPLFALLLSGLMSLRVSGVATLNAVGLIDAFAAKWPTAWLSSWAVPFPAVMVVAPLVRRIVARLIVPRGCSATFCGVPRGWHEQAVSGGWFICNPGLE